VREPRKFDIFPVAGALFVSGLSGERTQFLLGVVPLLLNALQPRFKVLLRFPSHGPIPFSRWQVLHDGTGASVARWRTRTPGRDHTPLSPAVNTTCVRQGHHMRRLRGVPGMQK
jgi:hypothetical protein